MRPLAVRSTSPPPRHLRSATSNRPLLEPIAPSHAHSTSGPLWSRYVSQAVAFVVPRPAGGSGTEWETKGKRWGPASVVASVVGCRRSEGWGRSVRNRWKSPRPMRPEDASARYSGSGEQCSYCVECVRDVCVRALYRACIEQKWLDTVSRIVSIELRHMLDTLRYITIQF